MGLETGNFINDLVITNPLGGDAKSTADDHLRLIKKALKECLNGFAGAIILTATDTGAAAAHVLTPSTALVGYTTGLMLLYRPVNAGTGACTVNVSALGAKSIKTILGADPTSGDIVANQPLLLMYDGTNFVIIAGTEFLVKTGDQTITGNTTMTGNLAVSGAISGPTITSKATKTGETYTGAHDFTGATPTFATQTLGNSSLAPATTAFVTATAFSPALPGINAGTARKVVTNDGVSASWGYSGSLPRSTRTSNTILAAADNGYLIDFTSGTFTQTLTAATTLGSGWFVYAKNSGTGTITFDPNGSETIDGSTTLLMYPGEEWLVQCDGTSFNILRLRKDRPILTLTASSSGTIDVEFDGATDYMAIASGITLDQDASSFGCLFKLSNSYVTTNTYNYHVDNSDPSSSTYAANVGASVGSINIFNSMGNAAAKSGSFQMRIFSPSSTAFQKNVQFEGLYIHSAGNLKKAAGVGGNTGTGALTGIRFKVIGGAATVIVAGTFRLFPIST